jgi:hypothetical protein
MDYDSGKLQSLRDFTVQIRTPDHQIVIGTGILVSSTGLVATCSHVVKDALAPLSVAVEAEVGVYFKRNREGRANACKARICRLFDDADDDVVLLQIDGNVRLTEDEIAVLGQADLSEGNPFRSYGFQELAPHPASLAEGKILGIIDPPDGVQLKAELVQVRSSEIDRGMSGAAVLDTERNLVVGLISETWLPAASGKNRDTAWAVDARVLSFPPFALTLRDDPLPRRLARQPQPALAEVPADPPPDVKLSGAPPLPIGWVDRSSLITALNEDYRAAKLRVAVLVGFGGGGKSSLARKWMDDLIKSPSPPACVFWWSFNTQPSVDAFLETALRFLSDGRIDPARLPGTNARVQVIASMLGSGRILFILDGLESVQALEGDAQGELLSPDLREFLELFAESQHSSFCLITSRLPVVDLIAQPMVRQHKVGSLTIVEGRDLLRKLGVHGSDEELDRLVQTWDAHALTLSLLGSYLAEATGGDASRAEELTLAGLGESRYERLRHLLESYDVHLSPAERSFLGIFSLFRLPVAPASFDLVFRAPGLPSPANDSRLRPLVPVTFLSPVAALEHDDFQEMVDGLTARQLLRHDENTGCYSLHALVRVHYYAAIAQEKEVRSLHRLISAYYVASAKEPSQPPLLQEFLPWIEAVHHLILAKDYNSATKILWGTLLEKKKYVLTRVLGAYESSLALLREFFPEGDLGRPCFLPVPQRTRVEREAAYTLMVLGHPREAMVLYDRLMADESNGSESALICQDLCRLNATLGHLDRAEVYANHSLEVIKKGSLRGKARGIARSALLLRGWVRQLRGNLAGAVSDFQAGSSGRFLEGLRGFLFADHLRQIGDPAGAREVALANLEKAKSHHYLYNESRFHRLLAMLDAGEGKLTDAQSHFDAAVNQARGTSDRLTLLEALAGRGSFFVRQGSLDAARVDLQDALARARESGFRLLEIDCRIAFAQLHQAEGHAEVAGLEAEDARQASLKIGYFKGTQDASAVLSGIAPGSEGGTT